jgi:hypothetical protein
LERLISRVADCDATLPARRRIVTNGLFSTHATLKKHIENCLTPPAGTSSVVIDRFGRTTFGRGFGKNENSFRHLHAIVPELTSIDSGNYLMLSHIADWNFSRELQFDHRWAYLPITDMRISLTQILAQLPDDGSIVATPTSCSSMLHLLPLAMDDCDDNFGLTSAFSSTIPSAPVIAEQHRNQLAAFATALTNDVIWWTNTLNPLVEDALAAAAVIGMLTSGYTPSRSCATILHSIMNHIDRNRIRIRFRFIPTEQNVIVDALSRQENRPPRSRLRVTQSRLRMTPSRLGVELESFNHRVDFKSLKDTAEMSRVEPPTQQVYTHRTSRYFPYFLFLQIDFTSIEALEHYSFTQESTSSISCFCEHLLLR